MNIKLSKRLELIASMVPDNSFIIDVGCDHALLDIYLYKNLKNVKIIASDINEKPLEMASLNIQKNGLENKIQVIKKDGIENLDKSIDTVIIAGMGGILISRILSQKENLKYVKHLIVSPNNDFEVVRKTIYKLGFSIEVEKLITEKKITYLVIKAIPIKRKQKDYFFGTLTNKDLETIYYYTKLLNTNTNILKKLPKKYILKRLKLRKENKKIKRFLEKR